MSAQGIAKLHRDSRPFAAGPHRLQLLSRGATVDRYIIEGGILHKMLVDLSAADLFNGTEGDLFVVFKLPKTIREPKTYNKDTLVSSRPVDKFAYRFATPAEVVEFLAEEDAP